MSSLNNLIDLSTVCVAMHDGFKANDDGETIDKIPIEMDPKDKPGEKTLRDRMPANTSEEEKQTFKAQKLLLAYHLMFECEHL